MYSKVKSRLGGELRIGISGGAPLAKDIIEFFAALDVLILEGYGLTECTTGATINRPTRYRFGTVGPALPGVELRVADDGEVLIKTDTVFAGTSRTRRRPARSCRTTGGCARATSATSTRTASSRSPTG